MHECYYGETGRVELSRNGQEYDMAITTERTAAIRGRLRFATRNH